LLRTGMREACFFEQAGTRRLVRFHD